MKIFLLKIPRHRKRESKKTLKALYSYIGGSEKNKALLYSWHKPGRQLYKRITGTCNEKIGIKGDRKSIGISRTFDAIDDKNEIRRRISIMARHVVYMVMSLGVNPTTFYLKINYEDGITVKKNQTVNRVFSEFLMKNVLYEMYEALYLLNKGAIKLSINVSNFSSQHQKTFSLLSLDKDIKEYELSIAIQNLRDRFGLDILKTADEL